jgi:hypothetical protein
MLQRSPLSTSELLGWTHSHLRLLRAPVRRQHHADVRVACARVALLVGRSPTGKGRPLLWALKDEYRHEPYLEGGCRYRDCMNKPSQNLDAGSQQKRAFHTLKSL